MSQPLLSILTPTVVGREVEFGRLSARIYDLKKNLPVEFLYYFDDKSMTIGEKRECLYQNATGLYSWQIDDDDDITDNAIKLIIGYIPNLPPCITFREKCIINGQLFSSNHSIEYDKWQDSFDGYDFVRCPFYKDVILTDIARSVPFPRVRWNEDEQWSMAIKSYLTTEIHIDQELYIYQHNSKPEDHSTRYGLDRD